PFVHPTLRPFGTPGGWRAGPALGKLGRTHVVGRTPMPKIDRVEIMMVDLVPAVTRTDAIQAFTSQETPIIRVHADDGAVGTGYSYTIGTGGRAVISLLAEHLGPRLIGEDP